MGHVDMTSTNQSNQESVMFMRKSEDFDGSRGQQGSRGLDKDLERIPNTLLSSMWSSDGLGSSNRLFQRSNSTPPTHLEDPKAPRQAAKCNAHSQFQLSRFTLRESVEENNQEDELVESGRDDLLLGGKHIQRSWSAPPVPDNIDDIFSRATRENETHHISLLNIDDVDTLSSSTDLKASKFAPWNPSRRGDKMKSSFEATSIRTISPIGSPTNSDTQPESDSSLDKFSGSARTQRGYVFKEHSASISSRLSLVDRVQGDFPRTPSPVYGFPPANLTTHTASHSAEQMLSQGMASLHLASDSKTGGVNYRGYQRMPSHADGVPAFDNGDQYYRGQDGRHHLRTQTQGGYHGQSLPVGVPPGFQAPPSRGLYGASNIPDPRVGWFRNGDHHLPVSQYPVVPVDFGQVHPANRGIYKSGSAYLPKSSSSFDPVETPPHMLRSSPVYPVSTRPGPSNYGSPQHYTAFRSKYAQGHKQDMGYLHPVGHSYSSTSLLEEFKGASKADKWDLTTIRGHLIQFARDQTGSRFIQQRLEKADEQARSEAFAEIFPHALLLMTDVFGNYVIQKLFDHGSVEQQRLLVNQMKKNMVSLALQVYGCRVIQKALEVTQVEEQLVLIRELKNHVLKCVVDQNGNHVLQKCIEAASWKKGGVRVFGSERRVTGEDIQFIIDDFVGQAAALSMHAYGCRVIQRVLEHCAHDQIRPIVNEIIFKCRDLVKDQFGNYVVQHVIVHGELEHRNIVMQTICPEIAKWSQHKYASNVVEACLEQATDQEIAQIVNFILECDESGASCALLPMMKHMYGNYVVQKLLDKASDQDRHRIECIIRHNADYLKRFTYGKHVLSRLERDCHPHFF